MCAADRFRPLASKLNPAGEDDVFGLTILPKAKAEEKFSAVRPQSAPVPTANHTHTETVEPVITLKREGDRVTVIEVQCSCGQVIELKCDY